MKSIFVLFLNKTKQSKCFYVSDIHKKISHYDDKLFSIWKFNIAYSNQYKRVFALHKMDYVR